MQKINNIKIYNESKGFTLIEMLVSIALFSVVIMVTIGSIITIIDVNRKSQSLAIVMNDLNFVLESMTRTMKTGESISVSGDTVTITNQDDNFIEYRWENDAIQRRKGGGSTWIDLTSNQIEIENAQFVVFDENINKQPRLLMTISGIVNITNDISSSFDIQTTVSLRNLDDDDIPTAN